MRRAFTIAAFAVACGSSSSNGGVGADAGAAADGGANDASVPSSDASADVAPVSGGLGPAQFGPMDLDPPSDGATITFEQIGAAGFYPSLRDPATGPCDADHVGTCCRSKKQITSDQLTPWDEELIMTLRGPMNIKQIAVYQPGQPGPSDWSLVSAWDDRAPTSDLGVAFSGKATPGAAFAGKIGSECLVDVSTADVFACGAGSVPFCPTSTTPKHKGWAGSKLFVLLAAMPHSGTANAATACSTTTTGNWFDASWVGLGVGELVRAGSFSSCQCYAKDPAKGYLADGCGQFNVFEIVNDNNSYKNLDVFSTDMIDYSGYVGQGPCGSKCNVSMLTPQTDLIDKTNDTEAAAGAVATPAGGPSAAFRRPASGYRYFLIALDVASRTVQLALVHPRNVPASIAALLPNLPGTISAATVSAVLALRLPR